jgi:glycosyltransferase involved in cell wall biosynthesis
MNKNIGFVSTRLAGIDGVSLEANKWVEVFESSGHSCFWLAGELDTPPEKSFLVPEAHFKYQQNIWINEQVLGKVERKASVTKSIHDLSSYLQAQLQQFITRFKIDLLIIENALAIPLNIPLGIALAELISETQIPTIAHHHDFYWERINYLVNAVGEYIRMAFPPNLPNIEHVVINSLARDELAYRKGIQATTIPNVLDFENYPFVDRKGSKAFRALFGLKSSEKAILQPTRIIKRKGIEHAIELIKALQNPEYKLLLSHQSGDEGNDYAKWIWYYARTSGVDLLTSKKGIVNPWNNCSNSKGYSLWNVYINADFITFPSIHEGFGNAFLEAVYFKKPLLINRYATFVKDIEPKGFDIVAIDGHLTKETIQIVREILESPYRKKEMVDNNYEIAKQNYSYSLLRKQLNFLLTSLFGNADSPAFPEKAADQQPVPNFRAESN